MFDQNARNRKQEKLRETSSAVRCAVQSLESRRMFATVNWDGGPSGEGTNFLDPVNWAGDALPLAADTAVIGATGSSPTITLSGTPAVQTITSSRNLRMTGGTLSGGTLAFSGGAALLASNSSGTLSNIAITGDVLLNSQDSSVILNGNTSFTAARLSASNTTLHMRAGYTLNSLVVSEGNAGGNRAVNLGFGGGGTVTFGPLAVMRLAAGSVGQMLVTQSQITTLVNNGLISAEGTGQHLSIQNSALTNNGTLQVNAGAMTVQPSNWTNAGTITGTAGTIGLAGNLNATAGIGTFTTSALTVNLGGTITNTGNTINLNSTTGSWNLTGGTINSGAIIETGANLVMSSAGGTLSSVAVTGDLILNTTDARVLVAGNTSFTAARLSGSNTRLHMAAGYTLNSTVISEGTGGGNRAVDLGFGGGGTITFGPSAVLRTAAGSVGQLLVSQSQISTLINNGLISSDAAGQHISIAPTTLVNNGTLQTTGTGAMSVSSSTWTNPGTVTGTGGTFNLGGTFNATAGIGTFNTSAVTVNVTGTITNTGNTLTLNATTGSWQLAGGTINNGSIISTAGANLKTTSSGGALGSVAITGDLILNTTDARVLLTGNTSFTAARLSGSNTRLHMAAGYTLNSLVVSEGTAGGNRSLDLGFTGGGTITFGPSAVVRTAAGSVGQIVIGQSQVSTLINNGLITSDAAGQHISITPSTLTNNGTLQTTGTGAMTVGSSTWTNAGAITGTGGTFNIAGNFNATAGIGTFTTSAMTVNVTGTITNTGNTLTLNAATGPWRLAGGTINNGTLVESGANLVTTTASGVLNSVAITGDLLLSATDVRVQISGTTSFNAARLSGANTFLLISPGYTLNSQVVSEGTAGGNRTLSLAVGAAGTVTIGPSGVVRTAAGSVGQIVIGNSQVATLVNNGLISAEANGQNLLIQPSVVTNNGMLSASNGSRLNLNSNIGGNPGQVRADGSGSILTIQTGTYTVNQQANAINNGMIYLAGTPTKAATFNASGRFVIDYTGAANTPFAQVKADVISGYAGGAWNGAGINSTAAAVTPRTAVGYAEASTVLSGTGGVFAGANVDGTAVLVRYTRAGDANIDGTVNISDFAKLAAKFNQSGEWTDGDSNYDGVVNIGDFSLLASNFNQTLPSEFPRGSATATGVQTQTAPLSRRVAFGTTRIEPTEILSAIAADLKQNGDW